METGVWQVENSFATGTITIIHYRVLNLIAGRNCVL